MDLIGIIVLLVWAYGIFKTWRDITYGTGLLNRANVSVIKWINKLEPASIITKVVLAILLGFAYVFYAIIMLFLKFIQIIF